MKTFMQWLKEDEQKQGTLVTETRTEPRAKRNRDRLTRMETMLRELIERSGNHGKTNS
jgi:hypothetical protein